MPNVSLEGLTPEDINGLASVSKSLLENPKTRKEYLKLLRVHDPNVPLPEVDAEEAVTKHTEPLKKQVDELTAKLAEKEARERLAELKRAPIAKGYLKDESELPDLEKYMKENGFTAIQYEQAARHRNMERQLADPTPSTLINPPSLLPKGEEMKDWRANPRQKGRAIAHEMITQFQRGQKH